MVCALLARERRSTSRAYDVLWLIAAQVRELFIIGSGPQCAEFRAAAVQVRQLGKRHRSGIFVIRYDLEDTTRPAVVAVVNDARR